MSDGVDGNKPVRATAERRHYRPAALAELLPSITRAAYRRRPAATAGLIEAWSRIAGTELAARSTPRRCAGGTLTVACSGPAALELQHRATAILDRANRTLGPGLVTRLRIVQDPELPPPPSTPPPRRAPPVPISLPGLPDGPLREALERLGAHLVTPGSARRE